MSTPNNFNFVLFKSYTFQQTLDIVTGCPPVPVDLTGYTIEMIVKDVPGGTVLQDLTSGNGLVITPTSGKIVATITPTQSNAWNLQNCPILTISQNTGNVCCAGPDGSVTVTGPAPVYVLNVTDPSGNVQPYLSGYIGVGVLI